MGLFSATPHHLYKLGLLDTLEQDEELEINFLMSQALITITTLPFHLVNDLWRWRVSTEITRRRSGTRSTGDSSGTSWVWLLQGRDRRRRRGWTRPPSSTSTKTTT